MRGVSLAAELVDSLMCLWEVARDPTHQHQKRGEIEPSCSFETVRSEVLAPRCRVPRPGIGTSKQVLSVCTPSSIQFSPQLLAQTVQLSLLGCREDSDIMGYGGEGRQVRGACYRCGGFGNHPRFCQQPNGNQQGGKGGKRRALDGSPVPEMLPKLPGPDEPTNTKAGKGRS